MFKREPRQAAPSQDSTPEPSATPSAEPFSAVPDFAAQRPSYYPTHPQLRLSADTSSSTPVKLIDERLGTVKKTVDRFLKYLLQNTHLFADETAVQFLDKQAQAYAALFRQKATLALFQASLKKAHLEIAEKRRFETDLSLDTYGACCAVDRPGFADTISAQLDAGIANEKAIENALDGDSTWQFLRHVPFILSSPEDPLPEENADDDLAVAGGKVPLKDPLSMDFFREPVMSKKCKHVFEKTHIETQLQNRHQMIDCPIPGCSSQVSPSDLQQDKLMDLRVKVFQATEKKREQLVRI